MPTKNISNDAVQWIRIQGIGEKSFSCVVHDFAGKYGSTAIATELGVDPSVISRFKNDEGGLKISQLEKMLKFGGVIILSEKTFRNIISALFTLSNLCQTSLNLE